MAIYFLVLDEPLFEQHIVPALTASWRQRSLIPCRPLCTELLSAARLYAERYHVSQEESLLSQVAQVEAELPFDRSLWRFLVGEVLLFAAAEIPEFQTAPDTLACLVDGKTSEPGTGQRERFTPIQQAHYGTRDLILGSFYRPDEVGLNDTADVARLADYLTALDPGQWRAGDLARLPDLTDEEEQQEEVAFARQCLASLRDLYQRAAQAGQVIVCEVP